MTSEHFLVNCTGLLYGGFGNMCKMTETNCRNLASSQVALNTSVQD